MTQVLDYSAFVRAHTTALLRSAFLLTGDRGTAEELVQDTLVRLYPHWSQVEAADVPIAYVRRSLTNNFLNGRRRKASGELLLADLPERGYDPDLAGRLGDRELVRELLNGLPPKQRAVLVLRFFHDLSDEQIAADLGCRQGTVRSIVSRALSGLRELTEQRAQAAARLRTEPPPCPGGASATNGTLR